MTSASFWRRGALAAAAVAAFGWMAATTGGCSSTPTVADGGINCGAGSTECNGSCTAIARDPENCGACGKKCAAGESCSAGICTSGCGMGTTKCGAECVDTKTDDRNCGACGTKCAANQVCNAGACATSCSTGQTQCGMSCVDAQTDRANCGACGTVCKDGEICSAGKCEISCQAGLTKCTKPLGDGGTSDASADASGDGGDAGPQLGAVYCANLQTENTNCGACGATCAIGKVCVAGACVNAQLIGSGTDQDPYRMPAPYSQYASCKAAQTANPNAVNGIYLTRPLGTDIKVYCDMTGGGFTYETFGFGPFTGSFPGWVRLGAPDFQNNAALRAAFEYLYARDFLTNLQIGWNSSNCCFINTTNTNFYGFAGNGYMYPANASNDGVNCNGGYNEAKLKIYLVNAAVTRSSFTQGELSNVSVTTTCLVSNNPAIFARRYQ
jgi:hypothetical protein